MAKTPKANVSQRTNLDHPVLRTVHFLTNLPLIQSVRTSRALRQMTPDGGNTASFDRATETSTSVSNASDHAPETKAAWRARFAIIPPGSHSLPHPP